MKSKMSILMALVLILSFSLVAYGAINNEKVEAFLAHDMTFRVDGKMWKPMDLDGTVLTPIIYKDRSYVPVRALLEEKDVMVGFDNNTRTIILDYPDMRIDKSSPMIMKVIDVPGEVKDTTTIEITPNKNFDLRGISFNNETSMELAEGTEILLNGKELNLETLVKSREMLSLGTGKVKLEYNPMSKLVTSVELVEDDSTEALKINVEIEFSGPPWKIKITIRF